ncbi:hypothetical protein F4804DRAFT_339585 [Jackrogersella minutella]|nr:hypothetical protein F4804DRAFT_339585 [Jackrogersella minutella]
MFDAEAQRRMAEMATAFQMSLSSLQGPIGSLIADMRANQKEQREATERKAQLDGWSIRDIGYFHPDLDTTSAGTSDVVVLGKETHWRSVYLFIDAVKAARTSPARTEVIKEKFWQLLRGRAQAWWGSMLSQAEKDKMMRDNDHALSKLLNEFKIPEHEAMERVRTARYSREDCLKNVSFKDWAMELFRNCRAAHFSSPDNLMSLAYNSCDESLRAMSCPPSSEIGLDEYISHLDDRQKAWRAKLLADGFKDQNPAKAMGINERLIRHIPGTVPITNPQRLLPNAANWAETFPVVPETSDGYWGQRNFYPRGNFRQNSRERDEFRGREDQRGRNEFRQRGYRRGNWGNKGYDRPQGRPRRFRRWVKTGRRDNGETYLEDEVKYPLDEEGLEVMEKELREDGYFLLEEFDQLAEADQIEQSSYSDKFVS